MNAQWRDFLTGRGAVFGEGRVLGFGDSSLENRLPPSTDAVADLSHRGVISASGPEAGAFLQGQFTNDIHAVTDSRGQISGYCSPKGRLLALFYVMRHADAYCLVLPAALVGPTLARLRLYKLRADVDLQDRSDALVPIGISGPGGEAALARVLGAQPRGVYDVTHGHGLSIMRLPGMESRFLTLGAAAETEALWTSLSPPISAIGAPAWELLDIRAGIPVVVPGTQERFVPQMVNLDALHGISFNKGCYTGQEIVARSHYLGRLKQRLYRARWDSPAPLQPGDSLFSPRADTDHSIGTVVTAQPYSPEGQELLAVINIEAARRGDIRVHGRDGPGLVLEPLPYKVREYDAE